MPTLSVFFLFVLLCSFTSLHPCSSTKFSSIVFISCLPFSFTILLSLSPSSLFPPHSPLSPSIFYLLHFFFSYSPSCSSSIYPLFLLSLYPNPKHHRYHGRTLCDATNPGYSKDTGNSSCTYVKPCIPSIQTTAPLQLCRDIVIVLEDALL
jgi:hypothetical protein